MRSSQMSTTMGSTMMRTRSAFRPPARGSSSSAHSMGACVMVSVGTDL